MKKLIGALALAAMVATSAFAEVSFGGWVRTLPTFVGSNGEDIKTGALSASWGGPFWARFDSSWASDDGKAGLNMRLNADAGGVGTHDDVGIWLKPIDMVTVQIGSLWNFAGLRGDFCYGSWNWLRPNTWIADDEGLTFNPGSAHGAQGIGVLIAPTEALKIVINSQLANTLQRGDEGLGKSSIAAAYTIDGIGTIKAGFFGDYNAAGDASKYGTIEGAFDLTAVDKLFLTVGVAYRIASSDYWKGVHANDGKKDRKADGAAASISERIANAYASTKENYMLKAALGASYGITEAFKLSASFAMFMFNKDVADDPMMQFGVGVDYALNDTFGLVADVRMLMPNNKADPSLSFLAGITGSVGSNASLGIGFQGGVGFGDKANAVRYPVISATEANKFAWAVPIKAELWF